MSAFSKGSHSGKGEKSAPRRQDKNNDQKDGKKGKGDILNVDLSSLDKSKKTGKLTPPDQWSLSVDLLPKSVAAINKDRRIAKIMGFVTVGVLVLCFIAGLVANQFVVAARGETDDARLQQTTLTARKAEFKGIPGRARRLLRHQRGARRCAVRRSQLARGYRPATTSRRSSHRSTVRRPAPEPPSRA
ncbi:hypothetical protein [Bifidobacterium porcinum]|uniref:hypothetical protein n=1 Tax=Bifidobacterium porcinum TaxID=212365 RepID=UPI000529C19C|nr:hypothetical protein [Bifidobacterium porcinum]